MKTTIKSFRFIMPVLIMLLVIACEKENGGKSLTIGGDTNFAENQVGATAKGITTMNGTSIPDIQSKVVENSNGITTFETTIPVPNSLKGKESLIGDNLTMELFGQPASSYIDSNGKIKIRIKATNSSEGFALINSSGKQIVIMKYDSKVGDKWFFTSKDNKKLEYKVIHHSTTDDYQYAFFNIKVVKVEHPSSSPGYSKIIFIGNHKFGLVGFELYLEDGTIIKSTKI